MKLPTSKGRRPAPPKPTRSTPQRASSRCSTGNRSKARFRPTSPSIRPGGISWWRITSAAILSCCPSKATVGWPGRRRSHRHRTWPERPAPGLATSAWHHVRSGGAVPRDSRLGHRRNPDFQLANGKLVPVGKASTAPGAGPRHIVFHPNGRILFVINELNATVTAFAYDPDKGADRAESCRPFPPSRPATAGQRAPPKSPSIRRASFCTPRTAATTASSGTGSIRRQVGST